MRFSEPGGSVPVAIRASPALGLSLHRDMNDAAQDRRLKVTLLVVLFGCLIFLPAAFYYGIFGVLTLVSAAVAVQHFIAVFRSRPDVCWGAGTMVRFRMSRLARFILGLWFAYFSAHLVVRGILKLPGSPYYLAGHAVFALLVALARWMDTGRFRL
jgi:hypothetical protein